MFWWRISALEERLRRGPLDTSSAFKYLLANTVLTAAVLTPSETFTLWDWLGYASTLALSAAGVYYAYRRNGHSGGTDLLGRFFSISWVMLVRTLALLIPAACGLGALVSAEGSGPYIFALQTAWIAGYYWRIGVHIGRVAQGPVETEEPAASVA
jgi:hypothetical protein